MRGLNKSSVKGVPVYFDFDDNKYVTPEIWSGNVWNLFICFVRYGFI